VIVNARFLTQKLTGVQRYAIEISRALKEIQPDIRFLSPKNIIHKNIAEELKVEIIGNHTGYIWEQWDLPRYLKKNAPGKILINPANVAPLSYHNKVVTIHDTAPIRHPEWYSWRFAMTYKWLLPRVAKSSRIIFSDSEFSKKEIVSLLGVPPDKIEVIYCAADKRFRNTAEKIDGDSDGNYILCVASLDPRKNFTRLVAAINLLPEKRLKLVIVGTESGIFADSDLEKSLGQNDLIEFTGRVDDHRLIKLYQNARLFVYPSLYEGFGLPPLEAMACGCPCVVSDSGSLPEICGDAAVYCDPADPQSIADKVRLVLDDDDLRRSMIQKGLEQAKKYSWQRSAAQLLAIVKGLKNEAM